MPSTLKQVQTLCRRESKNAMETQNAASDSLSEVQAAQRLGITLDALHRLLDQYVFNNGTPRPEGIRFTHADLLMLSYWCDTPNRKVLSMPRRKH